MKPLRLYLLIFSDSGCESSVYQDIESLIKAWEPYSGSQDVTGVIHVGFGRPQTVNFEEHVKTFRGRMLLTASAKWVCLAICNCSFEDLFEVEKIPIYLALNGWGYHVSSEEINQYDLKSRDTSLDQTQVIDSQVGEPRNQQVKIIGSIQSPPWLLSVSLADLKLQVRTYKALSKKGFYLVGDLLATTQVELMQMPGFGLTSLRDLTQQLVLAINLGPAAIQLPSPESIAQVPDVSAPRSFANEVVKLNSAFGHLDNLPAVIAAAVSSLEPSDASIMRSRMGIDSKAKTLVAIGKNREDVITRQRVQQIEDRSLEKIGRDSVWMEVLEKKLSKLLTDRQDSLPLLYLSILDNWFSGIENMKEPFQYLLAHKNILDNRFSLLEINDQWLVTKILKEDWDKALEHAVQLLKNNTGSGWTLAVAKSKVDDLLGIKGRELSMELWAAASSDAHFVSVSPGYEPILVSYGKGIKELVVAVLSESQAPLHYKEITRLINEKYNRNSSESTVQNAAANVGVILERGIYGLPKRISLNPDQQLQIHASVLEVMRKNIVIERQWHFDELFKLLKPKFGDDLDIKVLDLALKQCKQIKYLGREVWMLADADPTGNTKRIDIHQAVVSMLKKSGKPLSNSALKESISIYRGFGDNFQIHVKGSLISLPGKMWGIAGRDD